MLKKRIIAVLTLIIATAVGLFVFAGDHSYVLHKPVPAWVKKYPFKLGLDLSGGTHLVYRADVSKVSSAQVGEAMASLRDVIERRVNIFGVSEPVVQVENGGFTNNGEERLLVDLPGITDIAEAVKMIGQTPLLEFKIENPNPPKDNAIPVTVGPDGTVNLSAIDPYANKYIGTDLTGRYLKRAQLEFDQNTREPIVGLQFDDTGSKLFEKITQENVGKTVAIYLDGQVLSAPVVRQAISGGQAQISGSFTPQEAKTLVGRLNSGALPVPIELISTQTIGPILGEKAVNAGMHAGIIAFLAISAFFLLWYRLPGIIAIIALSIYTVITLLLFKLIPVTLTSAGIAGFIISLGMAVDANVLIFERVKEEMRNGRELFDAIKTGFERAWLSIRDANTSSLITALILFWVGTSLIKGFALTFGVGVIVSLFSAAWVTRIFLYAVSVSKTNKLVEFLFGSGFSSAKARQK